MNPLKPGTDKAPTGQQLNVSLAFAMNKNRWQKAAFKINQVIESIPYTKRVVSDEDAPNVTAKEKRTAALMANAAADKYIWDNSKFELPLGFVAKELVVMQNAVRYDYLLDSAEMDRTMSAIERILQQDMLDGSDFWTHRFFLNDFIQSASDDGTTGSFESAVKITTGTTVEQNLKLYSAQQQLQSPAYLDRLRLVNGRVFESTKGLTGEMKSQLRLTLTEGVSRGVGVRDLKGMINKRLGIGMARAERIARTEINNAYTTAYMDEATELNNTALKESNWMIMQCHRSALSPTTRNKHGARHGVIVTATQQADWWAIDGNKINCLCATLDVLVDKVTGEVLQQKMIDRMVKQRGEWFPVTR